MNSDDATTPTEPATVLPAPPAMTQAEWAAHYRAKFQPNGGQGRPYDGKNHADPISLPRRFRRSHRHIGNSRRDHNED